MELFELKYFAAVAQFENIHRASEALRVSPASLSKAIARLENELAVSLFSREGRNIHLTDHGRLLKIRASQIVQLEESAKLEISGRSDELKVVVAGPEVLLAKFGIDLADSLKKKHRLAAITFHACEESKALGEVAQGDAHLAIVTADVPAGLSAKPLGEAHFQTVVGEKHPLHSKRSVSVEELLEHPFVSPSHPLLGRVGVKQSLDGWRDDEFPRKLAFLTSSLKLLETLVVKGQAVAYLPDYFTQTLPLKTLKVTGCPYSCTQRVKLVARRPKDLGWLNQLF